MTATTGSRSISTAREYQYATFGAGAHYCMGSSLARAEIRVFLEEWLARIPDFAIAEGAKLEVKVGAAAMMPSPAPGMDAAAERMIGRPCQEREHCSDRT